MACLLKRGAKRLHRALVFVTCCSMLTVSVQDLTCIQLLSNVQELEQMGRVDEIPIHSEASALNHAADTDRYGVHTKQFADRS